MLKWWLIPIFYLSVVFSDSVDVISGFLLSGKSGAESLGEEVRRWKFELDNGFCVEGSLVFAVA